MWLGFGDYVRLSQQGSQQLPLRAWMKARSKTFWWASILAVIGAWSQLDPSTGTATTLAGRIGGACVSVLIFAPLPYGVRGLWRLLMRGIREKSEQRSIPRTSVVVNTWPGGNSTVTSSMTSGAHDGILILNELHPWVREGMMPFWGDGHYRQGVEEAARRINHEVQRKVGRFDLSEAPLLNAVFSADLPQPGVRRLRPPGDRRTDNWKSELNGLRGLGMGCFSGIRNIATHSHTLDWDRAYAMHLLAAFSLFSIWVERCDVDRID